MGKLTPEEKREKALEKKLNSLKKTRESQLKTLSRNVDQCRKRADSMDKKGRDIYAKITEAQREMSFANTQTKRNSLKGKIQRLTLQFNNYKRQYQSAINSQNYFLNKYKELSNRPLM